MAENIIVPYQRFRQNEERPKEDKQKEDIGIGKECCSSVKNCTKKKKDWNVKTHTDLFLLGKTGNGKSATGNSILQFPAFISSDSTISVTDEVDFDYTELDGRVIKVVDVRGVCETRMTTAQSKALFIREMENAIVANPKGYHAFLIVLRYSNRFTQEEVDTINFLKAVFGETFVKDHCIIVMTGGDFFSFEHSSEGLSFKNWCDQQQGPFRELLQECCHRIILFNNKSKDEAQKKKQVIELLKIVDDLKGTRYTDEKFKQAKAAQTELIMKSEVADLRENALVETRLILQKLKSCQESLSDEQEALEQLLARAEALIQNVSGLDKKTKLLQSLIDFVGVLKINISLEIKVHVDIKEWRKSLEIDQKKMELKVSLKKAKLTNQYLKSTEKCSDDDKIRLKKDLNEKVGNLEKKFEQEKQCKEKEFFVEIDKRRDKLKLDRQKQEIKYKELKSNYIQTFINRFVDTLTGIFQSILSVAFNRLRIDYKVSESTQH